MDRLRDLFGPGLILVALAVWLVRRAVRAARNEAVLEEQRLQAALAQELSILGEAPVAARPSPARPQSQGGKGPLQRPGLAAIGMAPALATGGPDEERGATPAAPAALSPAGQPDPLAGTDRAQALPEHVQAVALSVAERTRLASAARIELLWIRSAGAHVAWCERRLPAAGAPATQSLVREVICVARFEDGRLLSRAMFG